MSAVSGQAAPSYDPDGQPLTRSASQPQPNESAVQAQANPSQPGSPAAAISQQSSSSPSPGGAAPSSVPEFQKIIYKDGLLTVEAQNVTLFAVLDAIHNKTGIQFEGTEGAKERVAIQQGPASASDVLNEVLRGSGFNFVIIGREDFPNLVQKVILTPRPEGVPEQTFVASQQQFVAPPVRSPQAPMSVSQQPSTPVAIPTPGSMGAAANQPPPAATSGGAGGRPVD